MNLKDFKQESSRTMAPTIFPEAFNVETLHGIIGISSEAGELLGAVKKAYFYGQEPDLNNIREELGDIMWYMMAVARGLNFSMEDIMQENIEKLRLRYPEQFTTELSALRLDRKGVEIVGYCDGCVHLSPQESEQTTEKEDHWCKRYKIKISHMHQHPRLPMPWNVLCVQYMKVHND